MPPFTRNNPPRRVWITGLGLVTPLGVGAWPTFRALLDGKTIADRAANLYDDTLPVDLVRGLGGVASARHSPIDPAVELAERAAREAITEAGVEPLGLTTYLGCSKGAVVALEKAAKHVHLNRVTVNDLHAVTHGPHEHLAHHLRQRLGIEPRSHCVAACASSLVALDRARRALQHGQANEALVLSAEAALTPMFIHSYRRLGVLAPTTVADYRARPLDERRSGFMLAEAGVAVVLQARPADAEPPRGAAELVDTRCAAEAYDMIRSPADMAALRRVAAHLFAGRTITALHPHAPGTPGSSGHDATELRTLADVLNAEREMTHEHAPVSVYAGKGALGHTLGAAGLVSLVLACLMRRTRQRPPMPWLEEPMRPSPLPLRNEKHTIEEGHHAVFAAGFGGHTAGALIR